MINFNFSNSFDNRDKSFKYLRGSSIYSSINISNLSIENKNKIVSNLVDLISLYLIFKDKLNTNFSKNNFSKNSNGTNNDLINYKNSLKIFSINRASYFTLENCFHNFQMNNGSKSYNGDYVNDFISIIQRDHITKKDSQDRIMLAEILNYFNENYVIKKGFINSFSFFLSDLYLTTKLEIKNSLNQKKMNSFLLTNLFDPNNLKNLNCSNNSNNSDWLSDFNNLEDLIEIIDIKNINPYINKNTDCVGEKNIEKKDLKKSNLYFLKKEKTLETFDDIGGLDEQKLLIDRFIQAINNPSIYEMNDARLSTSILFYGPPGTGKSMLAKAIANELKCDYAKIKIPEITSKYFGESEKMIQSIFDQAKTYDKIVLFFDEIDSLARTRDGLNSEASHRILTTFLDNLEENNNQIINLFATNQYGYIDSAFKRAGRVSYIIEVPLPEKETRKKIFYKKIESSRLNSLNKKGDGIFEKFNEVDYENFSISSKGFNGADINEIIERTKVEKAYNEVKNKKSNLVSSSNILYLINNYERKNLN